MKTKFELNEIYRKKRQELMPIAKVVCDVITERAAAHYENNGLFGWEDFCAVLDNEMRQNCIDAYDAFLDDCMSVMRQAGFEAHIERIPQRKVYWG